MKSSLKNMVLTLFLITLVSGGALGLVYSLTKDTIDASKVAKTTGAISQVLPEFDNNPTQDTVSVVIDNIPVMVHIGKKGGEVTGYAVQTATKQGFSGEIKMMVGFKADGEIYNIEVLQHNETPGLGSKMADPDNVLLVSFQGKNPAELTLAVRKDGGDIDAITASTISSRAYVDAVKRAYEAYRSVALGEEVVQEEVDVMKAVIPEYDNSPADYPAKIEVGGNVLNVYTGLKGGTIVGYAAEGASSRGYHGDIRLLVGFLPDGTIYNIEVLEQDETPGFGGEIANADNPLKASFVGKKLSDINPTLSPEGDIDGITSATITSNAYIGAVETAYEALLKSKGEGLNDE